MNPSELRNAVLDRLRIDLLGPSAANEVLSPPDAWRRIYPSDVYLTGILFPRGSLAGPETDDSLASEGAGEQESDTVADETPANTALRPSVAGCSFVAHHPDGAAEVIFTIKCGTYRAEEVEVSITHTEDDKMAPAAPETSEADSGSIPSANASSLSRKPVKPATRKITTWRRTDHSLVLKPLKLNFENRRLSPEETGLPGMCLHVRTAPWKSGVLLTATMVNEFTQSKDPDRIEAEEHSFFQVRLEAKPAGKTRFPARPSWKSAADEDGRMAELVYRDAKEFAVGHTCSAEWETDTSGMYAEIVGTTWIPTAVVPDTSTKGDDVFADLNVDPALRPLSARWLADDHGGDLVKALSLITHAYDHWIAKERGRSDNLPVQLHEQAKKHLDQCELVSKRISGAIHLVGSDDTVNNAFRLANHAMLVQRRWLNPGEDDLVWRPFQIAFILLALPSVAGLDTRDRSVMDLLWFPTGGGKTEAYLGLIAFLLFYRRLSNPGPEERGAGVSTLMRYTLRLLTTQQFQRAAAMVCACEYLHRGPTLPDALRRSLGKKPFSLGLWVGRDAVPNRVDEALTALQQNAPNSPAQLEHCPCCATKLRWYGNRDRTALLVSCENRQCELGGCVATLPIWTVDDDVYRESPSVVIGTVDKFAQIVRNTDTAVLFGLGTRYRSPDLIVQDELHLISGPLGTMTGIYETAIDRLCTQEGVGPKIIGSTATIRRAEQQIRALFDRDTRQFPPPAIDARNSCFAMQDDARPGRLYVGVTTAGRSAKFTLQAVGASLLQASHPLENHVDRDAYWTLVIYFNSLRELGGAWLLTQDDIPATVREYAVKRREDPRKVQIVEEMTSRVTQLRVREMLDELKNTAQTPGVIDVLLASNMISVGVDIPRLGLMVVNGQPKTIAEYIQATSRVGRGDVPGIIVGVFNNNKARDRSHYESFRTWHSTLYREVESTSVTPFASRARDRALHAVLVALVRHLVTGMEGSPHLSEAAAAECRGYADLILERVARIDPEEHAETARELLQLIDEWKRRARLRFYWNDKVFKTSLLLSAERAAALRATGRQPGAAWPTPNSMRSVEPGSRFLLVERLRADPVGPLVEGVADAE